MNEVAVRVRGDFEPLGGGNSQLQGLVHIATVESDLNIYVWCWGETARSAWIEVPETAVCLRCIGAGPRKSWVRTRDGILVRQTPRHLEIDTETR